MRVLGAACRLGLVIASRLKLEIFDRHTFSPVDLSASGIAPSIQDGEGGGAKPWYPSLEFFRSG